ncbi:hypothetical protein SSYIS1_04390 [Serratia symbiotica]|uniref:Uncharacterized protein n=1 Tax=Serratia symbiotica TaxID=138074 RepID=A0A455VFJ5_9GAMM|nr:hypothetical protein SSYIS1_04390 [Serratia symbiotica]
MSAMPCSERHAIPAILTNKTLRSLLLVYFMHQQVKIYI